MSRSLVLCLLIIVALQPVNDVNAEDKPVRRQLYVAAPGVRNYLEYGGHGVLVFDIDAGHKFAKRIPTAGLDGAGKPLNVKGICANASTQRLYVSTIQTLQCFDLLTEKLLWEKAYDGGCDRMAIAPDGKVLYVPSLEKNHWHVVNGLTGDIIAKIEPKSGAHNTVYGLDGKHCYLAGLKSPLLSVADTSTHQVSKTVGPFTTSIRPFTINGKQTLCFVCLNDLLGFEIGDITTGRKLHRIEVTGYEKGPVKRHGCPSHGIGLTPDEREIWVCDAFNQHMHVFDATVIPPKQLASLKVRDEPGWITFSLDGKLAYPSTGDVFDVATRTVIATLADETGAAVQSEKMLEIDVRDQEPVHVGDQFGVGRVQ